MNNFSFFFVLLHLSLTTAVIFTQVFEWQDGMDYEWPSEAKRTQALENKTFNPKNIEPIFMAIYGRIIFLSLKKYENIPVSLVSLPTSSASSASPKLTPFQSWDMHGKGDCNKIEEARGLEVDSVGRLWVLDNGSKNCNTKLWIFDLSENKHTNRFHRFPSPHRTFDLVLDESPNGTLAFISHIGPEHIVVFSLEKNQSWIVKTPGIAVLTIALSPKGEPRQLYLTNWKSYDLYSISVTALRNGTQIAYPEQIGKWTGRPYRMLIDSHGIMFAAFWQRNFILSWNTSEPLFKKQLIYEDRKLDNYVPFTLAFDSSGNFWMTEHNKTGTKPRLLMAAVGAKSYIFETSSVTPSTTTTTTISLKTKPTPVTMSSPTTAKSEGNAATEVQESCILTENSNENSIIIITLICVIVLLSLFILWPILGPKMNNLLTPQSTNEAMQMSALFDYNEDIDPAEEQFEEVTYAIGSPSRPLHLVPTCRRFISARDLRESDASEAEDAQEIWRSASCSSRE